MGMFLLAAWQLALTDDRPDLVTHLVRDLRRFVALRIPIHQMSDLLERFSQKLMGRLNGEEAPAATPAPDA